MATTTSIRLRVLGGPIKKADRVQIEVTTNTSFDAMYPLIQRQVTELHMATLACMILNDDAGPGVAGGSVNTSDIVLPAAAASSSRRQANGSHSMPRKKGGSPINDETCDLMTAGTFLQQQRKLNALGLHIHEESVNTQRSGENDDDDDDDQEEDEEYSTATSGGVPTDELRSPSVKRPSVGELAEVKTADLSSDARRRPVHVGGDADVGTVSSMFDFPVTPFFYDICLLEVTPEGKGKMIALAKPSDTPRSLKMNVSVPVIALNLKDKHKNLLPQDFSSATFPALSVVGLSLGRAESAVSEAGGGVGLVEPSKQLLEPRRDVRRFTVVDRMCIAFGVNPSDYAAVHRLHLLARKCKHREHSLVTAAMNTLRGSLARRGAGSATATPPLTATNINPRGYTQRNYGVVATATASAAANAVAPTTCPSSSSSLLANMSEYDRQLRREFCRDVLTQYHHKATVAAGAGLAEEDGGKRSGNSHPSLEAICSIAAHAVAKTRKKNTPQAGCLHTLWKDSACAAALAAATTPMLPNASSGNASASALHHVLPTCLYDLSFLAGALRFSMSRKYSRLSFLHQEVAMRLRVESVEVSVREQLYRGRLVDETKLAYRTFPIKYVCFHQELYWLHLSSREEAKFSSLMSDFSHKRQKILGKGVAPEDDEERGKEQPTLQLESRKSPSNIFDQSTAAAVLSYLPPVVFGNVTPALLPSTSRHVDPNNNAAGELAPEFSAGQFYHQSFASSSHAEGEVEDELVAHRQQGHHRQLSHAESSEHMMPISLTTTPRLPPTDDKPTAAKANSSCKSPSGEAATVQLSPPKSSSLENRVAELELVVVQQHQLVMKLWNEVQQMRADRACPPTPMMFTSPMQQRNVSELVKVYEAMEI